MAVGDVKTPAVAAVPAKYMSVTWTMDAGGFTYSGFVNADDPSVLTSQPSSSIAATAISPVGDHPIAVSGAEADNYEITHVNGNLTISPAPLTVTADNKEIVETESLPDLTYSVSGFVNGEDASVVTTAPLLSTDADNSVPGDYLIVPSGAVASNYVISNVNGTMKIKTAVKPKVTSLVVSNSNPSVGDKVTLTASATGDVLTYEWYNGKDLVEGATSNTLVIEDIGLDQGGRFQVFAKNLKGKARKLANIRVSERANQVLIVVGSEPAGAKDVTSPSDTIVGTSTNSPDAEVLRMQSITIL